MARPLQRHKWAKLVWDELEQVQPQGLRPHGLRARTGLTASQVAAGISYLRETDEGEHDTPVVYNRRVNAWFIAPTWREHVKESLVSEYFGQAERRFRTAGLIMAKAERAFPTQARRIRKLERTVEFLRVEMEEMIEELEEA